MTSFRVPRASEVAAGVWHRAPGRAANLRRFRIYRFDPDTADPTPRIDTL